MRIAYLGWGSLIWDQRSLRTQGEWRVDGPQIPIEFARISADGRLTLVICPECPEVNEVRTLWAVADHKDLKEAMENLREREDTSPERIGCLLTKHLGEGCQQFTRKRRASKEPYATVWQSVLGSIREDGKNSHILNKKGLEQVRRWAIEEGIDAVLWTDLPSNWDCPPREHCAGVMQPFNEDNVIAYLQRLRGGALDRAERYIRFAPQQVDTPIRRRIEKELGWGFRPD